MGECFSTQGMPSLPLITFLYLRFRRTGASRALEDYLTQSFCEDMRRCGYMPSFRCWRRKHIGFMNPAFLGEVGFYLLARVAQAQIYGMSRYHAYPRNLFREIAMKKAQQKDTGKLG